MDIWETNKLALFIAFVIPGFVSLKTYELLFPSTPKDSTAQLIDAVAYSCVNYALLFLPIYWIETHSIGRDYPRLYVLFWAAVLLLAPIAWVFALRGLRSSKFFLSTLPHPTAKPWDYVFGEIRREFWVLVTLKSGKKFGGKYSGNSFASSAPAPPQLYLEEAWHLNADDSFERRYSDTAGVLILSEEIESVELFNITYPGGEDDGREGKVEHHSERTGAGGI